jgi:hypothetical protein
LFGVSTKQGKAYFQSQSDCFMVAPAFGGDTKRGAASKKSLSTYLFFIP